MSKFRDPDAGQRAEEAARPFWQHVCMWKDEHGHLVSHQSPKVWDRDIAQGHFLNHVGEEHVGRELSVDFLRKEKGATFREEQWTRKGGFASESPRLAGGHVARLRESLAELFGREEAS